MAKRSESTKLLGALLIGILAALGIIAVAARPAPLPHHLVVVHAPVYEFFAGTTGVQCEIDTGLIDVDPVDQITCFTTAPPRRTTLDDNGAVTQCRGVDCLANPGTNTPVLPENTTVRSGPHWCVTTKVGVRCGNATSATFTMSRSGTTVEGQHPIVITVHQQVVEFYGTPRSGVECELDVAAWPGQTGIPVPGIPTEALCLRISPPAVVSLDAAGGIVECHLERCLSNAGLGTPIYGSDTVVFDGPFTCRSAPAHVICRARHHGGFAIGPDGIRRVD
jgi:hypothetical protein